MSLAFPAIATQIVRKRLIREWFRQIYGLWDRPGSTISDHRGVRGWVRIAFEHSLDEEPGIPKRTAMAPEVSPRTARPRMSQVRHTVSCRGRPT